MTEEQEQTTSKALAPFSGGGLVFSSKEVKAQIAIIQDLMKSVMVKGEHYGKIPGCGDKPSLFKSGAEKLKFTFRLRPMPMPGHDRMYIMKELPDGHREYIFEGYVVHIETEKIYGYGVGSASTMEAKYRYIKKTKSTGKSAPKEYWDLRKAGKTEQALKLIGGKKFDVKKNEDNGRWEIHEVIGYIPNPDIANTYNTVYKMAKKRFVVDITLDGTAASDLFTQDMEDFSDYIDDKDIIDVKAEEVEEKPKPKIDIPPNATPFNRTGKSSPKKTESKPTPAPQAKDDLLQTDYQLPEDLVNQDVRKLKVIYKTDDPMTDKQKFQIDCLSYWSDLPENTRMSLRLIRMGLKSQKGVLYYYTGSQKNRAGLTIRKFRENADKLPGFDQDIKTLYGNFEAGCKEIVNLYVELGKSHKDCEDRTKSGREKWATSMFYNLVNESNDEGTRNGLTLKEDSFYSIKSAKDFIENEVAMAKAGFKDGEVKTKETPEDMDI